jgi:hypothetical protein
MKMSVTFSPGIFTSTPKDPGSFVCRDASVHSVMKGILVSV